MKGGSGAKFLSPVDLAICIDYYKKNTKWNNTLKTYFITNIDHLWLDSESLLTSFQSKLDE